MGRIETDRKLPLQVYEQLKEIISGRKPATPNEKEDLEALWTSNRASGRTGGPISGGYGKI